MTDTIHGSCLCGEITYEITGTPVLFQYCHCSRCRKITGSAHSAGLYVKPEAFRYTAGEDLVNRFDLVETKYYAPCFCSRCGSSMPWLSKSGTVVIVPAGTLDEDPGVRPQQSIYWDSRAEWLVESCELVKFSELPTKD